MIEKIHTWTGEKYERRRKWGKYFFFFKKRRSNMKMKKTWGNATELVMKQISQKWSERKRWVKRMTSVQKMNRKNIHDFFAHSMLIAERINRKNTQFLRSFHVYLWTAAHIFAFKIITKIIIRFAFLVVLLSWTLSMSLQAIRFICISYLLSLLYNHQVPCRLAWVIMLLHNQRSPAACIN